MSGRKVRESSSSNVPGVVGLAVFVGVFLALLGFCMLPEAFAAPPRTGQCPQSCEPRKSGALRGRVAVAEDTVSVSVSSISITVLALAPQLMTTAGSWCGTYAPYLWAEQNGGSRLCKLKGNLSWESSIYVPAG